MHIWAGEDTTPMSTSLTKCTNDIFDTGFYQSTVPCTGSTIAFRRDGYSTETSYKTVITVTELRLYQTPNLLTTYEGTVTISAPAPSDSRWAATNLITHLDNRSSGTRLRPYIDWSKNSATYDSCYKTTNAQLGPEGDTMVVSINLGKPVFVHAVLVV